jgi:protein TonB
MLHLTVIGLAAVASVHRPETMAPAIEERIPLYRPVAPSAPRRSAGAATGGRPAGERVVLIPGPVNLDVPAPLVDAGPTTTSVEGAFDGGPSLGEEIGGLDGVSAVLPLSALDRAVQPLAGNRAPDYPADLRRAGIEGTVRVRFIVDTTGRVEPASLVIVSADEPRFVEAVRRAVPPMRFSPAEARGRKVRMLVELPFVFRIER